VKPFLSRMGITRVANVTGLDRVGIPVVIVCRPNSRALAVTQGKGLDLTAAKASGIMEAIESYHAERIRLPLVLGTYKDLITSYDLVHTAGLPRTSGSVFTLDKLVLWIEAYDLVRHEYVWLPYDLVHLNYTVQMRSGPQCFLASSNGLASGNTLVEAISQGICEVVERDATTLWQLLSPEDRAATEIDLSTVDDDACRAVLDKYDQADVSVNVWEITSDIGISAFRCEISDRKPEPFFLVPRTIGMGCHPARQIALMRALTEAAQSRLTFIAGSRDDMPRSKYTAAFNPHGTPKKRESNEDRRSLRDYRNVPTYEGETFDADVAWELGRLQMADILQVLVVDLSLSEFGVPVVRVVVPGLEMLSDVRPDYVFGVRAAAVALRRAGPLLIPDYPS
jgi:YcaO-like protein with predicted kinase domain